MQSFAFPGHARYFPDRLFTENYRTTSYLSPQDVQGHSHLIPEELSTELCADHPSTPSVGLSQKCSPTEPQGKPCTSSIPHEHLRVDPPMHFSQALCLSYYSTFRDVDRLPVISTDSRAGSCTVTSAGKGYRSGQAGPPSFGRLLTLERISLASRAQPAE